MKRIIPNILALSAAFVLASCAKDKSLVGRLSVALECDFEISADVQPATKGGVTEASDEYIVTISDGIFNGSYAELKGREFIVPVGTYVIEAYNCTADEALAANSGYGQARYYGLESIEVLAAQENPVSLVCRMANAMMTLTFDESFSSVFDAGATSVTFATAERSLAMSAGSEAYFDSGDEVTIKIVSKKIGSTASAALVLVTQPIAVAAATAYDVVVSYDEDKTAGGITFTVGAVSDDVNDWISLDAYAGIGELVEDE